MLGASHNKYHAIYGHLKHKKLPKRLQLTSNILLLGRRCLCTWEKVLAFDTADIQHDFYGHKGGLSLA